MIPIFILYVTLVAGGCPWVDGIYRDYNVCMKKKAKHEAEYKLPAACQPVFFSEDRDVYYFLEE